MNHQCKMLLVKNSIKFFQTCVERDLFERVVCSFLNSIGQHYFSFQHFRFQTPKACHTLNFPENKNAK